MKTDGLFEPFKNPDGTYNGVKMLAVLSGLSESEVRAQWEKVKLERLTNG